MNKAKQHNWLMHWLIQVYQVCRREFYLVFHDEGVIIFFLIATALYPVLYALIYNPELVHNEPVVVVDDSRSQLSREFARKLDATQEITIVGYAANMQEAQEMMHRKQCYGIVHFPREFSTSATRGEQAHLSLYCDMSVVMRYKAMYSALTNVTQAMSSAKQAAAVAPVLYNTGGIINSRQVPIGNTQMGIASAVLLFILPLVLQQTMILGIAMLHGGSIERRRRNGGRDPMAIEASVSATIIGKTLCYQLVYVVPTIYVLHFLPMFFDFPQNGHLLDILCLALPFIIAVSLMGQTLQAFVNERESVFLVIVFSSVVFVFLTGLSWPRYAMSPLWRVVGDCVPSTWMGNAYVLMQSDGALLHQVAHPYCMLWLQCPIFYLLAYLVERYVNRRRYRSWIAVSEGNDKTLTRIDLAKNGVG